VGFHRPLRPRDLRYSSSIATPRDIYDVYWGPEGYAPVGYSLNGPLLEVLEQHVGTGDDVLDLGCGDGSHCGPWITEHARSYLGVDVSATAVEMAQKLGLAAAVISDAGDLDGLEDGSFDRVVCVEVLEHLLDPIGAARETHRVLRTGGSLIATVPNAAHWRCRADALIGRWNPGGDDRSVAEPWRDPHIRFFSPQTFTSMLVSAGFQSVDIVALQDVSLADRMPGLRRMARREMSPVERLLAERFPALLSDRICAIARL
jgi:2-polyprenyl-6-hydroxyphenyl methylase/3-demethylubiquinone-9 3-methyltransferase